MKNISTLITEINDVKHELNVFEQAFIKSALLTSKQGVLVSHLSSKQIEIVQQIHKRRCK